jgi:hypothetical protein
MEARMRMRVCLMVNTTCRVDGYRHEPSWHGGDSRRGTMKPPIYASVEITAAPTQYVHRPHQFRLAPMPTADYAIYPCHRAGA